MWLGFPHLSLILLVRLLALLVLLGHLVIVGHLRVLTNLSQMCSYGFISIHT